MTRKIAIPAFALVLFLVAFPSLAFAASPQAGFGNALSFQVNSYATVPHSAATAFTNQDDFSVELWVRPGAGLQNKTLIRQDAYTGEYQWWVRFASDGTLEADFANRNIGSWDRNIALAKLPLTTWTHVAVVKSGSRVHIYFNGIEVLDDPIVITGTPVASSLPLTLGGDGLEGNYFDGQLDEIRVWRAALSPTTVDSWQFRGADPSHPNWPERVAYYALDSAAGTQLVDSAGVAGAAVLSAAGDSWIPSPISLLQTTDEDVALSARLAHYDADGGILSVSVARQPDHGHVVMDDAAGGRYTYTPEPNYDGADSFTYTVADGTGVSAASTVDITVLPDADPNDYTPPQNPSVSTGASAGWGAFAIALAGVLLVVTRRPGAMHDS